MKFIYIILLLPIPLLGQNSTQSGNAATKAQLEKQANRQIKQLKKGALFVRLQSNAKEIDYFKKYENFTAAEKLRHKTQEQNAKIIEAFTENYSFSKLYFFSDTLSRHIANGTYDSLIFVNQNGLQDTNIQVVAPYFFVCEFGESNGRYGIIVRDKNLTILREPFPFFVKIFGNITSKKAIGNRVAKLHKNLEKFYE